MTNKQIIHIGMVNSFNLITERNTMDEIQESNLTLFAHTPEEDITIDKIKMIMNYFESIEMYEHCVDLMEYTHLNFDEKGVRIGSCECEYPVIKRYTKKMSCDHCNKRLFL